MKIIAVGQNYRAHNEEMHQSNPSEPVIFMKPDSAILRANKPFFIPEFSKEIHYETELLVKINRLGKYISPKFAHRYYDEIGLGIDFTARDLQQKLKAEGKPWELAKAFDGSAVVGDFLPKERCGDLNNLPFYLDINQKTVQKGNSKDMIFEIDYLISFISQYFTLKIGDIIFTGTPVGVGKVEIGDRLEGYVLDNKMFDFNVR